MDYKTEHNKEESRFEICIDGELAVVEYEVQDNCLTVTHTGVPKSLSGQGIAALLTKDLLDYARENGLKIIPLCSYAEAYIKRHAEYQDLLK